MDLHPFLERLPLALGVNLALGALAWRGGAVRPSGFAAGVLLGTAIFVGLDWRGFTLLVAFFVLGSALTRLGYARKARLGTAEPAKGARGASNAFAKSGLPAAFALGAGATGHWLWSVGFTAAFATAAMDTTSSEVGPLVGRRTISLRDGKAVPPGTAGAVSLLGTTAGLIAAGFLGGMGAAVGILPWGHVPFVVLGAGVGNLIEGILGARGLLSHTWLNVVNLAVGAGTAGILAWLLG